MWQTQIQMTKYGIIFIPANFEPKNFRLKLEKLAKFFCLKIGRNENFIMEIKFDNPAEMLPEKEVLWFFSRAVQTPMI